MIRNIVVGTGFGSISATDGANISSSFSGSGMQQIISMRDGRRYKIENGERLIDLGTGQVIRTLGPRTRGGDLIVIGNRIIFDGDEIISPVGSSASANFPIAPPPPMLVPPISSIDSLLVPRSSNIVTGNIVSRGSVHVGDTVVQQTAAATQVAAAAPPPPARRTSSASSAAGAAALRRARARNNSDDSEYDPADDEEDAELAERSAEREERRDRASAPKKRQRTTPRASARGAGRTSVERALASVERNNQAAASAAAAAAAASSSAPEVSASTKSTEPPFSMLTLDWDAAECESGTPLLCSRCEKNKRDVLLRPCGHVPFCITCACALAAEHVAASAPTPCPTCNQPIILAHHLFL